MDIDPSTGRVTWIPTVGQVSPPSHDVTLRVDDGNGGSASRSWQIEVFDTLPNRPPVIDSVPNFIAVDGVLYEYPVHAVDPDGESVTCSLVSPPPGMIIDPDTCLLSWPSPTTGLHTVAIRAQDPSGAYGAQVYELDVHPPNNRSTLRSCPTPSFRRSLLISRRILPA